MNRHRIVLTTVLLTPLLLALPAAASGDGKLALTVKGTTLGLGADLSYRINDRVHVRGMAQVWDYDETFDDSGVEYDGTLDLESFGAAVDFFPTGGGFVLSAGLLSNGNEVRAVGVPQAGDTFDIGNNTYTSDEIGTLRGAFDFDSTAPFATIGWGNPFAGGRFGFRAELGALFQGEPMASLTTDSSVPGLAADLEIERQEFQEDVNDFDIWPIVSLGLTIRF